MYTANITEGLLPANDKERLQALYRYQVLDTAPEEVYNRIAKETMQLFNTPRAYINFIDRDRVFFKASAGDLPALCTELPRYASFSSIAIHNDMITLFRDTHNFPQLTANPFVNGTKGAVKLRFFVAAPLRTPDGFQIGVLGTTDDVPREVTGVQLEQLLVLAQNVMTELNLRLQLQQIVKNQSPN